MRKTVQKQARHLLGGNILLPIVMPDRFSEVPKYQGVTEFHMLARVQYLMGGIVFRLPNTRPCISPCILYDCLP